MNFSDMFDIFGNVKLDFMDWSRTLGPKTIDSMEVNRLVDSCIKDLSDIENSDWPEFAKSQQLFFDMNDLQDKYSIADFIVVNSILTALLVFQKMPTDSAYIYVDYYNALIKFLMNPDTYKRIKKLTNLLYVSAQADDKSSK